MIDISLENPLIFTPLLGYNEDFFLFVQQNTHLVVSSIVERAEF